MGRYKVYNYSIAWIDDKLKKQINDVRANKNFKSFRAASKELAEEYELLRWEKKKDKL